MAILYVLTYIGVFIAFGLDAVNDKYNEKLQYVRDYIDSHVGWHVLKLARQLIEVLSFIAVGFILSKRVHEISWHQIGWIVMYSITVWCAKQSGFEGIYNLLGHEAKIFDWARYLMTFVTWVPFDGMPEKHVIRMKNQSRLEFLLHHCFRYHWIEAWVIFVAGFILLLKII